MSYEVVNSILYRSCELLSSVSRETTFFYRLTVGGVNSIESYAFWKRMSIPSSKFTQKLVRIARRRHVNIYTHHTNLKYRMENQILSQNVCHKNVVESNTSNEMLRKISIWQLHTKQPSISMQTNPFRHQAKFCDTLTQDPLSWVS